MMHLANLKIWNYRKYGKSDNNVISETNFGLNLNFNKGLNLLVGENDSGKTAIIDAIKLVLYTQSREFIGIEENDFHWKNGQPMRETEIRIECLFSGFSETEASGFLEWTHLNKSQYELRVWLNAEYKNNRIISNIKAGIDNEGTQLDGEARDLLRVTYLKPLRDAENELTPGYKSRLAQILKNHPNFQEKKNEHGEKIEHIFEKIVKDANKKIEKYFVENNFTIEIEGNPIPVVGATDIRTDIQNYLKAFFPINETPESFFEISGNELVKILQKLGLSFGESKSGLGSLNLLFIAVELLLWKHTQNNGLKLLLVEEIEAHLHPQAQLRLIEYLQKDNGQFILTTHSTTLASKIALENISICTKTGNVFPMSSKYTKLEKQNYNFLERFLDATKANLFFAKGVIFVEGDAENLLIPTIAEIIGKPLHEYGISIVNVGNTAFLHYARIFLRKTAPDFEIPVAVITDLDQPPIEYYSEIPNNEKNLYQIKGVSFDTFKTEFNTVDYSGLETEIFTNIDFLEEYIRAKNPGGKLLNNQKKWIKDNKDSFKREIINSDIPILRSRKKIKLDGNNEAKVKWFFPDNWTLEYEFALSQLKEELYYSILAGNSLNYNDKISIAEIIDFKKTIKDNIATWATNEKTAYEIFKPLLSKDFSKAITAQMFAKILKQANENGINVKAKLESSSTLKYILDAINHVTTGIV